MIKKLCCFIVVIVIALSMVACGRKGGDVDVEVIDETKTQLYINNFDGGFGTQWLYAVKKRFEKDFADFKGVNGKVGVQIMVDKTKDNGKQILTNMRASRSEVFFAENFLYYEAVRDGLLLDITDAVTETLDSYGESKSIEDKLNTAQQSYFKTNDKYYGLPHYESSFGIMYDIDMFEDEGYYFSRNKDNGNDGFIVSLSEEKSTGPDGEYGTYDDGLPATYDEFYKLCRRMVSSGVKPITWAGMYQNYISALLTSLQASYEGYDQMMLNYLLDGEATNLVESIDGSGNVSLMAPTTISNENGYLLSKQAGKYYALSFIETIIDNGWYTKSSFINTQSHTSAQEDFIYGRLSSKKDNIGMLFEGIWWENEADGIFSDTSKQYTEAVAGRYSRRFAMMPLPKAPGQALGKPVLIDDLFSGCFIKSNIAPEKIELAKEFVKYCNTDVSLVEFTKSNSTPKALKYEIPEKDLKDLSCFAKSLFQIRKDADIIYPLTTNPLVNNNLMSFKGAYTWGAEVGGIPYSTESVTKTFKNNGISAKNYFYGLSALLTKTKWDSRYSKYFLK